MSGPDTTLDSLGKAELRGGLPVGTRLRNYELLSVLGQGGFGITYRARDTTLERDVAIKEYLPTTLALREGLTMVMPRSTELAGEFVFGRQRFLDETRTLAKLHRAPAIVRVHDFLEANGTAYMVMALVEGETLEERLTRKDLLDFDATLRLLYPLLEGLQQVHAAGYLHRDIKPANIILDRDGNPTLIDFGASRAAMAQGSVPLTAIFTVGFAAAEQFTSAKQGPWTDIYGLSATLYYAISGQRPPSAFERILDDTYQPLRRLRPAGFPPYFLAAIDMGMGVRSSDRPPTIASWRYQYFDGRDFYDGDEETVVIGAAVPAAATPPTISRTAAQEIEIETVDPAPAKQALLLSPKIGQEASS